MDEPSEEWYTIPQGPPKPPPNIYALLNETPEGAVPRVDPLLFKMVAAAYEGSLDPSGAFSGDGSVSLHVGLKAKGQFIDGLLNGSGQISWCDGLSYSGDVQNYAVSGKGRYQYPSGDAYEGEVLNGTRHGTGRYTCARTGDVYEGGWSNGLKHGYGVLVHGKDMRSSYKGEWKRGVKCGRGTMVYSSGSRYEGEWLQGKRHGYGTMTWLKDGATIAVYKGMWKEGEMDGEGTYYHSPAKVEEDGKGVPVKATPTSPTLALGLLGAPSSGESARKAHQNYYSGAFQKGRRHGMGCFFYEDGSRYEGEWVNNVKHGEGKLLQANGVAFGGYFRDGKPDGPEMPTVPEGVPLVPLNIEDLLVGEVSSEDTMHRLNGVISRRYWDLRRLFRQYSNLSVGKQSGDEGFSSPCLTMLQFWKLAKDASLVGPELSLAELDRLFLRFKDPDVQPIIPIPSPLLTIKVASPENHAEHHPTPPKSSRGSLLPALRLPSASSAQTTRALSMISQKSTSSLPDKNVGNVQHRRSFSPTDSPALRKAQSSEVGRHRGSKDLGQLAARQGAQRGTPASPSPGGLPTLSKRALGDVRKDLHNGDNKLYFREFVEALVRLAALRYRGEHDMSLSDKVEQCLERDMRGVCLGSQFMSDVAEVMPVLPAHEPFLRKIFHDYSHRTFRNLELHRKRASNDKVITVRQFLTMLRDCMAFDSTLPMKKVLSMFDFPAQPAELPPAKVEEELTPSPPSHKLAQRVSRGRSGVKNSIVSEMTELDDRCSQVTKSPQSCRALEQQTEVESQTPRSAFSVSEVDEKKRKEEERIARRRQLLMSVSKGKNGCNVLRTITVDQELVFEEFLEALVRVAKVKEQKGTPVQRFERLLEQLKGAEGGRRYL